MLWWLNHYAFPDMAGLVIGYLNVWIIPVIKNRRVASWFAPDGTGGKLLFIGKTQFYPGKSTTCLTNSTPYVRTGPVLSSIAFGGEVSTPWLLKQKFRT